MAKFIDDLLKEPDGRYSRKSVIIMVSFIFTLGLGTYIAVDNRTHAEALTIFNSMLFFICTAIGIATVDKKILSKNTPKQEDI